MISSMHVVSRAVLYVPKVGTLVNKLKLELKTGIKTELELQ